MFYFYMHVRFARQVARASVALLSATTLCLMAPAQCAPKQRVMRSAIFSSGGGMLGAQWPLWILAIYGDAKNVHATLTQISGESSAPHRFEFKGTVVTASSQDRCVVHLTGNNKSGRFHINGVIRADSSGDHIRDRFEGHVSLEGTLEELSLKQFAGDSFTGLGVQQQIRRGFPHIDSPLRPCDPRQSVPECGQIG